jgi:hypothetical protein
MSIVAKKVCLFVLVELLMAVTAWLCGYEFDRRGPEVGFGFIVAIAVGAVVVDMTHIGD